MMTNETQKGPRTAGASPSGGVASLKHRAYTELKRQILSGELSPGMLLSERQLASELKMSKTPVHAALEKLEADGLVAVAAQQGIVVRSTSAQDMVDHFEIREALEPFVVARLAGRLTADQVKSLKQNLLDNQRAVHAEDVEANVRLDAEFHVLLCDFLGNREITRVMIQNREKVYDVIQQISTRQPGRMAGSLAEHKAIAEAIFSGDGTVAADLMKTHLQYGLQCVHDRNL